MKKLGREIVIAALLGLSASTVYAQELKVVPNEYIVKIKKDLDLSSLSEDHSVEISEDLGKGVSVIKPIALNSQSKDPVPFQESMNDFCKDGVSKGIFEHCSPNYIVQTQRLPNDARISELWGMTNIEAPSAWDVTTGSSGVVVAVVDTGVDYTHPDLAANMWRNPGEIAGNGIDDDGNGYVDDIHGINAINNSGNPMDDNSHGTHCSGTIAGVGNNSIGVAGVSWNAKIMGLKFLSSSGSGAISDAVKAINYMVAMKQRGVNIRVSSNSWGGGGFSQALVDSIAAANQAGIIFVAAAGNNNSDNDSRVSYPASYDVANIVSVAAIDVNNNRADFSNFGSISVDIGAPGVGILSTVPGNSYSSFNGTSMATPHVSGALALLLGREPNLSVQQAIQRLYLSGVETASLNGITATGRRLNVNRLLRNTNIPISTPTPLPCSYSVREIPFDPNRAAESAPILVEGDDSIAQFNAGTPINFHGVFTSSLQFSTNGVVYFRNNGSGGDYSNGANAPINSLAALHTDMLGTTPYGVRAINQNGSVVFFYQSGHYNIPGSPSSTLNSKVWGDINAQGKARVFIEFPQGYFDGLSSKPTTGITGPTSSSAVTYSTALRSGIGIEYTQVCTTQPVSPTPTAQPSPTQTPVPTSTAEPVPTQIPVPTHTAEPTQTPELTPAPVAVREIKVQSKLGKVIKQNVMFANSESHIQLYGSGNGNVQIRFEVQGQACSQTVDASLENGEQTIRRKLPKAASLIKKIRIAAGEVVKTVKIKSNGSKPNMNKARAIAQVCKALTKG